MQIYGYQPCGSTSYIAAFKPPSSGEEMWKWCRDAFGYAGTVPKARWKNGIAYGEIEFAQENDLMLFMLRWA